MANSIFSYVGFLFVVNLAESLDPPSTLTAAFSARFNFGSVDGVSQHLHNSLTKHGLNSSVSLCLAACLITGHNASDHTQLVWPEVHCKRASTCYSRRLAASMYMRMELSRNYIVQAARLSGSITRPFAFVLDTTDATRSHPSFGKTLALPILCQATPRGDATLLPIPDVHMIAAHSITGRFFRGPKEALGFAKSEFFMPN